MSGGYLTKHSPGTRLDRHRHGAPYAALVLRGSYIEAGDCGRFTVKPGHVILHGAHEAHQDTFSVHGADVLNLPVHCTNGTLGRVNDPDSVVRLAERDQTAACELLAEALIVENDDNADWPDQLSRSIIRDPDIDLGEWAKRFGIAAQSLSRGFRKAFGVTPKRFRAEQRALRALRAMPGWNGTGAGLAAELGFTDQAHMIKAVRLVASQVK